MVPTLLLLGLVLGRWWKVVIPAATVGWVALLIGTGVDSGLAFAMGAALVAVINVTVGILVFQAVWLLWQRVFRRRQPSGDNATKA